MRIRTAEAGFFNAAGRAPLLFARPLRRFAHAHLPLFAEDRANRFLVADAQCRTLIIALAEHAVEQQLFDHAAPDAFVLVRADSERGARRVLFVKRIAGLADKVANNATAPDALVHTHNGRNRLGREFCRVNRDRRVSADIARAARFCVLFAEIASHARATTGEAIQERKELARLLDLHRAHLLARIALIGEHYGAAKVSSAVYAKPFRHFAVATAAPNFLPVGLDRFRRVGVDHVTHVGLIDAHAEGDGRYHHDIVVLLKFVLPVRAEACLQAGMIGKCGNAGPLQALRCLLNIVARRRIDDAGLAAPSPHEVEDAILHLRWFAFGRQHQIWPIERVDEALGMFEFKLRPDVGLRLQVRGRRYRHARYVWKPFR